MVSLPGTALAQHQFSAKPFLQTLLSTFNLLRQVRSFRRLGLLNGFLLGISQRRDNLHRGHRGFSRLHCLIVYLRGLLSGSRDDPCAIKCNSLKFVSLALHFFVSRSKHPPALKSSEQHKGKNDSYRATALYCVWQTRKGVPCDRERIRHGLGQGSRKSRPPAPLNPRQRPVHSLPATMQWPYRPMSAPCRLPLPLSPSQGWVQWYWPFPPSALLPTS